MLWTSTRADHESLAIGIVFVMKRKHTCRISVSELGFNKQKKYVFGQSLLFLFFFFFLRGPCIKIILLYVVYSILIILNLPIKKMKPMKLNNLHNVTELGDVIGAEIEEVLITRRDLK